MHYEDTRVVATYHVGTEAHKLMMDATAIGLGASYGAKTIGAYDTLGNGTRTHEFEMSYNRANRARADFEDLGFDTVMRVCDGV